MADDASALLSRGRMRRAADGAPVVRQVADAWVNGEAIHWDAVDALGRTDRERLLTRELRTLAWLATQAGTSQVPSPPAPLAHPGVLERVLSLIAGVQLCVAILVVALAAPHSPALLVRGAVIGSCASAAVALLVRGRREVRARMLGHLLLLVAVLQARPLLDLASSWPAPVWLRAWWQALYLEAWLPVAMWRFARECPLVVRFTAFDIVSRGVLAAALAWSVLLASASARAATARRDPVSVVEQWWLTWQRQDPSGPFWAVLVAWALVALVTMAVRARQAAPAEAQRVRAWLSSLAIGTACFIWATRWRGEWPSPEVLLLASTIAWPWLAAVPVLLDSASTCRQTTWACLLARAQLLLAPVTVLALSIPALHLLARDDRPLGDVLADPRVGAALGVAGLTAVLLGGLRLYESRITARRRSRGHRGSGVACVASDVARARTSREIAAALVQHAQRALDTRVAAVAIPSGGSWVPVAGAMAALPGESAVAALLTAAGEPVDVGPASPLFPLLPASDRAWLRSTAVEVIAPIASPDGRAVAGLVLGARRDGRLHSRRDLSFVAAAVSTAGVAMDALAARHARTAHLPDADQDDELAYECASCGRLAPEGGSCDCGGARELAALPARLAGKFALERRLGRGGMGVVYLGTDTRLDRRVALKTLPRLQTGAAAAMHAEARAMAAVEHASVAVLYELHVWRETPVLVVEYLAGGTLAARLAEGALPAREAVALATSLADALSDLHGRGWLHGDIKPSNIGIGRDRAPKLLDFGLTRLVAHARPSAADGPPDACRSPVCDSSAPLAGTPLYLSPEALEGRPCGAHGDVWALSLVLFEMVAGAHPFRASSLDRVLHRVRRATPVDVHHWAPGVSTPLAHLLQRALHPQLSQRIATASDLAAALRVVAARL